LIFITKKDKYLKEENTSFEESKEVNTDSEFPSYRAAEENHGLVSNNNISESNSQATFEAVKVRKPRAKKLVNNI
jgi:hypothetical protein